MKSAIIQAIEEGHLVSARLRKGTEETLLRRRRAALTIEGWAIKTFLRIKTTSGKVGKGTTFTTWCGKVHGLYVSRSEGEMVATPFFLGAENGPSMVVRTYCYVDEDDEVARTDSLVGEALPGYQTSYLYEKALLKVLE
jgi:hypothetical protein